MPVKEEHQESLILLLSLTSAGENTFPKTEDKGWVKC